MYKPIALFTTLLLFCFTAYAQEAAFSKPVGYFESCTSIMVGKKASTDGSVMTSHTCDGYLRSWMNIIPAQTYGKDTVVGVYKGQMYTESASDRTNVILKGTIPQVSATYQYLNTAYPCLNEKQLGIGETTIYGRKELVNENGMFMIEELQRIAMERCTTARDAIKLMGVLVLQYGYSDVGECLTIADTKEVWHFEIYGEGPDKVGGVWAAVRIPDDHVGVSANIPRISSINLNDTNSCMASANIFDVAKKLGYWDGKEPFCFWKAYGGDKKAFSIREYFILTALAPSLNLSYDAEELPLSVKPEKPVSVTDVMALLRETYEGSRWDMVQNLKVEVKKSGSEETEVITSPIANPWMSRDMVSLLNAVKDSTVTRYRLISVPFCTYSHIIQLRDWLPDDVGGIAWLSFDNPGQSPRFPIFSGATKLPESFNVCGQHRHREDAAIWTYREANRLAALRWGEARKIVESAVAHFEEKGITELDFVAKRYAELAQKQGVEKARDFLTGYSSDFIGATTFRWKELIGTFWMYGRGGF